jgi:hypothetical protein
MIIKCTMREGITEADIEGYRYTFKPDPNGEPICSVTKEGHIKEILAMGPHCYVEFKPPIPVEQMSAKDILAAPEGHYEEEKAQIKEDQARADAQEAQRAEKAAQEPEAKQKDFEDRIEALEKEKDQEAPEVAQSTGGAMAESRIKAIIQSFRSLDKKRFTAWIDANIDQIPAMPEDVKAELAKKITKNWKKDPKIPGLDLKKYARGTDTTDKGHSNNK